MCDDQGEANVFANLEEGHALSTYVWLISSVVGCGGLESPENGTVDLREGTTFNSTAFYGCDDTFELVGNSTRVCLSSGLWSSEPPVCKRECHSLFFYNICWHTCV